MRRTADRVRDPREGQQHRGAALGRRAVTELARAVVAPGPDVAVRRDRERLVAAVARVDDPGEPRHDRRGEPGGRGAEPERTAVPAPPGRHGAVRTHPDGVLGARVDVRVPGRCDPHRRPRVDRGAVAHLAVLVVAPGPHAARRVEGQRMVAPGGQLDDAREARHRDRRRPARRRAVPDLAVHVVAPGQDRPRGRQRVAHVPAGDDLPDPGQARDLRRGPTRRRGAEPELAERAVPPGPHGASRADRQAVVVPGLDGQDVGERQLDGRGAHHGGAVADLAEAVVTPRPDAAALVEQVAVVAAAGDLHGGRPADRAGDGAAGPGAVALLAEVVGTDRQRHARRGGRRRGRHRQDRADERQGGEQQGDGCGGAPGVPGRGPGHARILALCDPRRQGRRRRATAPHRSGHPDV